MPLEEDPHDDAMEIEESDIPKLQTDFELVSYTLFYDEFLDTDLLQRTWPIVESALEEYGLSCTLDLVSEGLYTYMRVSTTKMASDPDFIFTAIDILELLSRSVPADWAIKILDCSCQHDIIKIGNQEDGLCRIFGINKEQFLARRTLLMGGVMKGLVDVTVCGIFLKGNTIAVLGSLHGLKMVRRIVEDYIAHDVPPAPRVQRMKKKSQAKKDRRIKRTSEVTMNLQALHV
ncbi:KRR1 small subunit processome component [Rosa sericea]